MGTFHLGKFRSEESTMSDPRQVERDPNISRNRYSDNRSSLADTSVWIAVIAAVLVVFGALAYYGGGSTEPNSTGTTSGQVTRAPATGEPPATTTPTTPPAMPAPAQR
jgi:hypothetical protein